MSAAMERRFYKRKAPLSTEAVNSPFYFIPGIMSRRIGVILEEVD
jgi:hypothetical protein